MDIENYKVEEVVDVIKGLRGTQLSGKPDKGALQLMREFYINLEEEA